jgi:arabinogalactan oligomer/maltooligosaccharide transport system permease protein
MESANFAYAGLAGATIFIALLIGFFGIIPGLRDSFSGAVASLVPGTNATVDTPIKATFFPIFWRSILWTVINIAFHLTGGMILALLLNRKMYLRGVYRTLLVFPWAVPQVIAVLAWKGEFHFQYGYVNALLNTVGIAPVPWLSDATWTFIAMLIVNIWLGIPFMMVLILGGLQSIPGDFYEAAEMDGANAWQQFWGITIPMLRPVLTPAIILGTIWTFNNFNVPFLLNGGGPSEHTNTLVSALYSVAFTAPNQYAFGSALSLVIFVMLLGFSIYYMRASGGLKSVYE